MNVKLQQPIETYFEATNNQDPKKFISIFAEDAVVLDDGEELVGLEKIEAWGEKSHFDAKLKAEVIKAFNEDSTTVVTAKVDGDFDKTGLPDPLFFDFHFTVVNGLVSKLEILLVQSL
ncbi:nuclear transport factor 2 family protein [Clostridium sp. YIM B02505]|uniref:Nuclear transport factor 2 family protein n=1 Tax=Clostridium yunnanense TaxID=2800325 RepID=A0ABS1ERW9_9CLOT|nr:nuclear transport factor 2 family protein [Clostridium yunnanense]MBK1812038.1 nuclear transport factor 2 family protein [Clostridium yunnanense]